MNYSLFTYEGAFRFPGVALRSRSYFTPLYHALLSLSPITFHLDSCRERDTLMAAVARDTLVLILPLPWAPNLRLPDPTDLIEEQCREISVQWGGARISITSQTGVRFPKQPNEMGRIREWKALNPADIQTHIFPKTQLMYSLINLVFYVGTFHIWRLNSLHLIGPLRYSLSCSHLQTLTHSWGHWEPISAMLLRQSAWFRPSIYPSFIPRFIPHFLLHWSLYYSQEPQSPEKNLNTPQQTPTTKYTHTKSKG